MSQTRFDKMMDFLNQNLTAGFRVESLAGDASFRRYHRIYCPMSDGGQMSYLLMDAPPEKESVAGFVHVAQIMVGAVNVPDIIVCDMEQGFVLLQDFGTVEFAHVIGADKPQTDEHYTQAMKTLVDLQSLPTVVDLPKYSDEKLSEEMDLFTQWFLPYVGVQMTDDKALLWQTLKTWLITNIQEQPQVVVHRDYHSRNLMMDQGGQSLGVIDFQDAVIGAYTYDLVSLVRDAYIDFDETWVNQKIAEFHQLKDVSVDLNEFTKQTNVMGVQRHLKVLGIFVRLYQRDGKARYLNDLPKVMKDILAELAWLNQHAQEPVLSEFYQWLVNVVNPAYQQVKKG